jgi:hypothetical protein
MNAMERVTYRGSNTPASDEARSNPQQDRDTSGRSADFFVDDPIPLFLSDLQDQPDPPESEFLEANRRTGTFARLVAGGLVLLAFAILVAVSVFSLTRVPSDKATVSVGGPTGDQLPTQVASDRPAAPQIQPGDDPPRALDPVTRAAVDTSAPRSETASRENVVSEDRAAPQTKVPAARAGNESGAPPSKTLDSETLTAFMARARSLLAVGDIAAARLLLERAASAQDATAAFLLARTYDPAVLGAHDPRSITADPAMARDWYRKAASFGSAEAQQRLTQLQD